LAEIRAFLFDMDGVIVDSNPLHRESWAEYNRRHGVETTEAMQQRMYGKRNDDIVRDFFGAHLADAEVYAHGAAKEQLYREMIRPALNESLVPGVREFLERHRGEPVGMATNAEPENVEFLIEEAGLRPYFRVLVDGHQVPNPKPYPDIYLRAAELLGVPPCDCVVFEDSLPGIEAARAAGMAVVGLTTTHHGLPGVDMEIRDFTSPDLEPWLANR
jgi:beta-phosphoglucomutase family hydrolase